MFPLHTPPPSDPEWWEIVGQFQPLATLLAAIIAGLIAWRALRQRSVADRRSEWWSRAQWSLDASLSDEDDRQEMGIKVLQVLADSKMASKEELDIFNAAWIDPLDRYQRKVEVSPGEEDNESTNGEKEDNDEHNDATGETT
ncbi:hypothetical protein [Arthrobacter sp. H14]|uniref:hypothetical protein n=1 Tax=Arthrobacter sp. H14 TaxID=1312959 RepID=UPI000688450B|nr:hypothetical protein [Arthrobacter sp. H14]